ncbi:MAG: NB-ARC domain-containing protein [Rhizonema sp. PD37]|nr:NB-ARC domain-containing protein [Rhizonema sp. PD37]
MICSVVINLGYGSLYKGFPVVSAGLWGLDNPRPQQFVGSLPPASNLVDLYRNWLLMYQCLCNRLASSLMQDQTRNTPHLQASQEDDDDELEINESAITNFSVVDFNNVCQQLQLSINTWLESPGIVSISRQLRATLHPSDEIRIIIETQDIIIQKLPWHLCSFFEDYPRSEISFSRTEYKRITKLELSEVSRNQVRILAILGNSQGIDLKKEQEFLQSLPDSEVEFLVKPSRKEFNDKLWDSQGWDLLFFAGHSQTNQESGIVHINESLTNNSLTIEQLAEGLKAALSKNLKLVIFNSCDGLGLAHSLEKLNMPTTIVMREAVQNQVAEEFFNYFLQAFAFEEKSLYTSVQQARRRLQGLEDDFPCASWLPVIFTNPAEEPPNWMNLKDVGEQTRFNYNQGNTNIRREKKLQDWGEAIDVSRFYGRNHEINILKKWMVSENCRLITIIGMGGIGKTALSVKLAEEVENQFDYLIWRSLQNAPPVEDLLSDLISFLSEENHLVLANSLDKQIAQLIECLRTSRCLVVLDNLESILNSEEQAGNYSEGYEGYGQILISVGDTRHKSCFLVTSREKPRGLGTKEGDNLPVRSLSLKGLTSQEGELILAQKGLSPSKNQINSLVDCYAGNPLALKIVSTTIEELFSASISDFLLEGTIIFGDIFDLLAQQFERLSILEKKVMYWVAIHRESVSLKELQSDLIDSVKARDLITALESLKSRSLIENQANKFTQQPVVMEYIIEELIEEVTQDIYAGETGTLNKYALTQVQIPDYIRNAQIQFILQPIAQKLTNWGNKQIIQNHFNQLLLQLKSSTTQKHGYAAGNIINLLQQLEIELNNYDLSNLTIWQANLQGINLQQTNFANSDLSQSVFTQTLGSILAAKFSPTDNLFATAIEHHICLWEVDKIRQVYSLEGHTAWVRALAFSPDGKILASGSLDYTIRLWNVETGQCLQILLGHTSGVQSVAFSDDGSTLASGSNDQTIRLWNIQTRQCLQILQGHTDNLMFVAFHPNRQTLITASRDDTVRLWNIQTGACLQVFNININWELAIALSHDGQTLVTGSNRNTVKLWDVSTGECIKTLSDYNSLVWSVAFGKDNKTIVTGSEDNTVKIWDTQTGECLQTWYEHHQRVWLVDLHLKNQVLLSISEDQTFKLWDISSRRCLKTLKGYSNWILSLAFSPDSQTLASSSQDQKVRLWNVNTGKCQSILVGHTNLISSVAFAPQHIQDSLLASGSDDNTIKLWNHQGECLKTLRGHEAWVYSVAFSPKADILASGSRDNTVKLWNKRTGACLYTLVGHQNRVKSVAFHPNGTILASASDDKTIKLWDVNTGHCVQTLVGHKDKVDCVAFRPDANILASTSCDKTIKLWDVNTGECLQTLPAHTQRIRMVAFSPDSQILVSCSDDQTIKLWDANTGENMRTLSGHDKAVWTIAISPNNCILASGSEDQTIKLWHLQTGECWQTLRYGRPYEGMNINNTTGITTAQKTILKSLGAVEE